MICGFPNYFSYISKYNFWNHLSGSLFTHLKIDWGVCGNNIFRSPLYSRVGSRVTDNTMAFGWSPITLAWRKYYPQQNFLHCKDFGYKSKFRWSGSSTEYPLINRKQVFEQLYVIFIDHLRKMVACEVHILHLADFSKKVNMLSWQGM